MRYAILILFMLTATSQAVIIQVPGDYELIADALDAAVDGDVIIIASGVYYENALVLKSGVIILGQTGNPADVVIDGQADDRVMLGWDLATDTRLQGITIRGGRLGPSDDYSAEGAGIRLYNSSPTFRHCLITDCFATKGWGASLGGGVCCLEDSHPVFEDCVLSHNTAFGGTGGAIYADDSSSVVLTDCELAYNLAPPAWPSANGVAGIRGRSDVRRCFIHHNEGENVGGLSGVTRLEFCVFWANVAGGNTTGGFGTAGAVYCQSNTIVRNCSFIENEADITAAISTGSAPLPFIQNCIFTRNDGWKTLTNSVDQTPVCTNIYDNADGGWVGVLLPYLGEDGNFSADPEFCGVEDSGDFRLQSDSPCAPGHHPDEADCGPIGAMLVGCGGTSTRATSWSSLKSMY